MSIERLRHCHVANQRPKRLSRGAIFFAACLTTSIVVIISVSLERLRTAPEGPESDFTTEVELRYDPVVIARIRRDDRWGIVQSAKSDLPAKTDLVQQSVFNSHSISSLSSQGGLDRETLSPAQIEKAGWAVQGRRPSLIGTSSGQLLIGNLDTVAIPGDPTLCFELAESMVADAKGREDQISVLAESDLVTAVRICAVNGSIILTCRNDTVTISPRKARPNDGCEANSLSGQRG